jgi:hypothetical protein
MIKNKNSIIKSHTLNDLSKNIIDSDKLLNIVLDLDCTIIYAKIFDKSDSLKIKITEFLYSDFYLGKFIINEKIYLIFTRPYFNYFINTISIYFNIFIYTNSYKEYCLNVIDLIKKKYNNFNIVKIIYRENNKISLIKYLSFLCDNEDDFHFANNIPNYDNFIKKTIIIDDSINIWEYDKKNIINVKKFIIGKSNYLYNNELLNLNQDNSKLINQEKNPNKIIKNHNNVDINYNNIDYVDTYYIDTDCVDTDCVNTDCVDTDCVNTDCVNTDCVNTDCVNTDCVDTDCVDTDCVNTDYLDTNHDIYNGYNFIFFNKNIVKDDILLILCNRLFIIYNLYMEKYYIDEDFNIQELISKYKL